MLGLLLLTTLAMADGLETPETSYVGASILQGDTDVTFEEVLNIESEPDPETYAFFEGNTLYVGNSDEYGNSIDGIVEFFWFQSSIDRGTDFYVAVIKVRATPGNDCPWYLGGTDCELWADDWQDIGEYPVVSVEAITDVTREQGAFRWDWAVPFENYGIDAYGQMSFSNQYGIGSASSSGAEGSALTAVTIPDGTNINGVPVSGGVGAESEVQVKGFLSSEFKVQTQYDVTLYEWDVFVNGRADLMAWDVFLNLGARADQSAYHEFFLPLQVEFGHPFTMDEFNFLASFDTGNINPFAHELGLSLKDITISVPYWEPEPTDEEIDETETFPEDTGLESDTGESEVDESLDPNESENSLELNTSAPVKSGCSTAPAKFSYATFILIFSLVFSRFRNRV